MTNTMLSNYGATFVMLLFELRYIWLLTSPFQFHLFVLILILVFFLFKIFPRVSSSSPWFLPPIPLFACLFLFHPLLPLFSLISLFGVRFHPILGPSGLHFCQSFTMSVGIGHTRIVNVRCYVWPSLSLAARFLCSKQVEVQCFVNPSRGEWIRLHI